MAQIPFTISLSSLNLPIVMLQKFKEALLPRLSQYLPRLSIACYIALLIAMGISSLNITPTSMFVVSLVMFVTCWVSASHLLGFKVSSLFVLLSLIIGFVVEILGTRYGWFFGEYYFTDVLQPQIFSIPIVIPMMWFNLVYIGYVLANLIIVRNPLDPTPGFLNHVIMSFLVAMVVTAYDLAADPYMVYVVKAWIMIKTDGWWFGETIQGFFGWLFVSFIIVFPMRIFIQSKKIKTPQSFSKWHALIPVYIYGNWMVFQMLYGYPMETRTISAFAMGIPLLIALISLKHWKWNA